MDNNQVKLRYDARDIIELCLRIAIEHYTETAALHEQTGGNRTINSRVMDGLTRDKEAVESLLQEISEAGFARRSVILSS